MEELTLEKKIEFCELYLQNKELTDDNCFICNRFKNYHGRGVILKRISGVYSHLNEVSFKIVFPELYKMVMEVGIATWIEDVDCYEFSNPWATIVQRAVSFR